MGLGGGRESELRGVRLADTDQAGAPVPPDNFAVVRLWHVTQGTATIRGGHAGVSGADVLEQEGHAGKGSARIDGCAAGAVASHLKHRRDHRIEVGVRALDRVNYRVHQFQRADLAVLDQLTEADRIRREFRNIRAHSNHGSQHFRAIVAGLGRAWLCKHLRHKLFSIPLSLVLISE